MRRNPSSVLRTGLVESCLTDERSHQSVGIVPEKQFGIGMHSRLERTVEEFHFLQVEVLRIEVALSLNLRCCGETQEQRYHGKRFGCFLHERHYLIL